MCEDALVPDLTPLVERQYLPGPGATDQMGEGQDVPEPPDPAETADLDLVKTEMHPEAPEEHLHRPSLTVTVQDLLVRERGVHAYEGTQALHVVVGIHRHGHDDHGILHALQRPLVPERHVIPASDSHKVKAGKGITCELLKVLPELNALTVCTEDAVTPEGANAVPSTGTSQIQEFIACVPGVEVYASIRDLGELPDHVHSHIDPGPGLIDLVIVLDIADELRIAANQHGGKHLHTVDVFALQVRKMVTGALDGMYGL